MRARPCGASAWQVQPASCWPRDPSGAWHGNECQPGRGSLCRAPLWPQASMPAAACVGPQGLRPALCSVPTGRCASTTTKSTSTGCVAARRIFCSRIPAPTWARGSTSRTSRWVDMAVSVCERPASERALPSHARALCTGEGGVGRAVAREARRVGLRLRALRVSPRPRGKA